MITFIYSAVLGGLDAPTGGQSQTNPHPILIRLSDNAVLPNRFRGEYRECFVIAAGYGDISSERAYLRTENLSCVRADGAGDGTGDRVGVRVVGPRGRPPAVCRPQGEQEQHSQGDRRGQRGLVHRRQDRHGGDPRLRQRAADAEGKLQSAPHCDRQNHGTSSIISSARISRNSSAGAGATGKWVG